MFDKTENNNLFHVAKVVKKSQKQNVPAYVFYCTGTKVCRKCVDVKATVAFGIFSFIPFLLIKD